MKYIFEEKEGKNISFLTMRLEDVPTIDGSLQGLAALFCGDLGNSTWLIDGIDKVLNGEEEVVDSGSNIFDFIITKDTTSVECIFESYGWNFTISTEVLREIAVTWYEKNEEFTKKHKKKHFWRRR